MGEAIITRKSGGSANITATNGYILLADYTVIGNAVSRVDFNGLDIGKGDEILLVSDVINSTSTGANLYLYYNNNLTSTNYYRQYVAVYGATKETGRYNDATFSGVPANSKALTISNIKLTNSGYIVIQNNVSSTYGGASLMLDMECGTSTLTTSAITSITTYASSANAIGIGSRFQLYKTNGTVVRTWDIV